MRSRNLTELTNLLKQDRVEEALQLLKKIRQKTTNPFLIDIIIDFLEKGQTDEALTILAICRR